MQPIRLLSFIIGLALLACFAGRYFGSREAYIPKPQYSSFEANQLAKYPYSVSDSVLKVPEGMNFTVAARLVRPAVVHVKTFYKSESPLAKRSHGADPYNEDGQGNEQNPEFPDEPNIPYDLYGDFAPEASGSGVIISDDGYIATNHHVVKDAVKVEVVLDDKRSYKAVVIGSDPNTDLALLKIDEKQLPFVRFGNSDQLSIGEWVLAIGNPFDLTSTVTAGIVSAKARNINILRTRSNMQVESFIQTDAAVNPGNSGGALVNLKGELIGVNTAIASNNGSFTGYAFAIPVTIVKKVMDDLLKYGDVQRAILGVLVRDITAELAREKGISKLVGVYIDGVNPGSAAEDARLKPGDIVLKINGIEVNSSSELVELVARNRPGDKIKISFLRGSDLLTAEVRLKSRSGEMQVAARQEIKTLKVKSIGAELQSVSRQDMEDLQIKQGVKVISLEDGKLAATGISEGFIITQIDKKPVKTPEQVKALLENLKGGVLIEGLNPDGKKLFFGYGE
ncbi:MAG: trypsin-like peptidase domain-containing protein [Bacteroidota bacterium]